MSEDTPTCTRCNRPTTHDGARLCTNCLDVLRADLEQVDDVTKDLLITRTKQDVISREPAVRSTPQAPLGFRPGAMGAADQLVTVLKFWVNVLGGETGDTLECVGWLLRHPFTIRYHEQAGEIVDQIGYAVGKARAVCDRPAERRYAGACPACGVDLYVREQASHMTCTGCRATYRAEQRYGELLAELRDRLATAAEIAAGIGRLHGSPLSRNTITQWHSRGRLIPRGHTANGHPMYRIGDVLDLALRPKREKSPSARSTRAQAVSPCTC